VEIVSGLTAGEQVVVEGPATMKDGDKVTVKER
jgi:multidrug efflux pump subunit AcrA (membrane-fusion protein)